MKNLLSLKRFIALLLGFSIIFYSFSSYYADPDMVPRGMKFITVNSSGNMEIVAMPSNYSAGNPLHAAINTRIREEIKSFYREYNRLKTYHAEDGTTKLNYTVSAPVLSRTAQNTTKWKGTSGDYQTGRGSNAVKMAVFTEIGNTSNQTGGYCVDLYVPHKDYDGYNGLNASDYFLGDVGDKLAVILKNSFNNLSAGEFQSASGVSGISEKEIVRATQFAIYEAIYGATIVPEGSVYYIYFNNDVEHMFSFASTFKDTQADVEQCNRVKAAYEYLKELQPETYSSTIDVKSIRILNDSGENYQIELIYNVKSGTSHVQVDPVFRSGGADISVQNSVDNVDGSDRKLVFDVRKSDIQDSALNLQLSATQELSHIGVLFHESGNSTDSQSMITNKPIVIQNDITVDVVLNFSEGIGRRVVLKKIDHRVKDGSEAGLPDATFDLLDYTGIRTIASSQTTNQDGEVTFSNLLPGAYLLRETSAPSGYKTSSKDIRLAVLENGEVWLLSDYVLVKSAEISKAVLTNQKIFNEDHEGKISTIVAVGDQKATETSALEYAPYIGDRTSDGKYPVVVTDYVTFSDLYPGEEYTLTSTLREIKANSGWSYSDVFKNLRVKQTTLVAGTEEQSLVIVFDSENLEVGKTYCVTQQLDSVNMITRPNGATAVHSVYHGDKIHSGNLQLIPVLSQRLIIKDATSTPPPAPQDPVEPTGVVETTVKQSGGASANSTSELVITAPQGTFTGQTMKLTMEDMVNTTGLVASTNYTLTSRVMRVQGGSTPEEVYKQSKTITSSGTGTHSETISFGEREYKVGETYVVYQKYESVDNITFSGQSPKKHEAKHEDVTTKSQTFRIAPPSRPVGNMSTTVSIGSESASTSQILLHKVEYASVNGSGKTTVTVKDRVQATGLVPKQTYDVKSEIYALNAAGTAVEGSAVQTRTDTLTASESGQATKDITFADVELEVGKTYVIAQTLTSQGEFTFTGDSSAAKQTVEHKSATDKAQSFKLERKPQGEPTTTTTATTTTTIEDEDDDDIVTTTTSTSTTTAITTTIAAAASSTTADVTSSTTVSDSNTTNSETTDSDETLEETTESTAGTTEETSTVAVLIPVTTALTTAATITTAPVTTRTFEYIEIFEDIPLGIRTTAPIDLELLLIEESVPLGSVPFGGPGLPYTGNPFVELFFGIGLLVVTIGFTLSRRI